MLGSLEGIPTTIYHLERIDGGTPMYWWFIMALNPPKLGVPFKQAEAVGAAFKGKVCSQYKFQ